MSGLSLSGRAVAVTGATGFVGRYLVRVLRARGARVIGVVRDPDKVPALRAAGVELRRADLADRAALTRGLAGADAVFANAALISIGGRSRGEVVGANVEGTRNLLRAAADAGVGRVVQTSSAVAYAGRPGHCYREGDPLRAEGDRSHRFSHYALSKAVGEREAWRLADALGLTLSTARPHTIYGAWDAHGFTKWFRRLMRLPVTPFPVGVHLPSVYAGDLAEAMVRMLERPAAAGRAYNIAGDPGGWDYWAHVGAYRRAGGDTPRLLLRVPLPLRRRYSLDRARQDLGFANRPLEQAWRETLRLEAEATPG